jgi:two-component system, NarL family, nitrate/nitrite response regulator NarL
MFITAIRTNAPALLCNSNSIARQPDSRHISAAMRILLADDHDLVRDSIEEFLKRLDRDVEVLHASTLPQALDLARQKDSALDAILLDLRMPGMNGLAGLKAMCAACATVPVVIISGETDPDTVRGALQAGAAGFLPKTMRGTAMLGAMRLILSGERYVPDLVVAERAESGSGASSGAFSGLTQREREVMSLLVQGLPNKEISQRLKIEVVTVALHLRSIYRKLGVSSRTQAVRLAMQQGWDG